MIDKSTLYGSFGLVEICDVQSLKWNHTSNHCNLNEI
jgi:hypothetical protein